MHMLLNFDRLYKPLSRIAIKHFNDDTKLSYATIFTTTLQASLLLNASPSIRYTHF